MTRSPTDVTFLEKHMEEDENAIDEDMLDQLNRLAHRFYQVQGYNAREGFDFSSSKHPQERLMFRLAYEAFEFFSDEGI